MVSLEEKFTEALTAACVTAQEQYGCPMAAMLRSIQKYGGVPTAREYLRKNRLSDGFDLLQKQGKLKLSMEALVVAPAYGALFTDKEVNACFEALCSAGYF